MKGNKITTKGKGSKGRGVGKGVEREGKMRDDCCETCHARGKGKTLQY